MNPIERPGTNAAGIRPNSPAAPVGRPAAPRGVATAADQAEPGAVRLASAGDAAPVDHDRVAEIRKAVEQGRYPVLPTRIADAMIAAGYLLRTK